MGFFSQKLERSDLKAGDHIYTWRTAFTYSHHGIYVGENKVVHFTYHSHSSFSSSSTTSSSCFTSPDSSTQTPCIGPPDCGFRKEGSGVVISCLECFLGKDSLYRFEYGVSRPTFIAKFRGGTCTMAESNLPEAVVHRAMYLLHKGFGNYDVFTNNCEDFALYCKTGTLVCSTKGEALGCSGQATTVFGVPLAAVIAGGGRLLVSSPVVMVTTAAVTYSFSRYATDIGVREDKVVVEVENMEMFQKGTSSNEDARSKKRQKHS